jgi:hypothetical protein
MRYYASNQLNVVPEQDIIPSIDKLNGNIIIIPFISDFSECNRISHTICQISFVCNNKYAMK